MPEAKKATPKIVAEPGPEFLVPDSEGVVIPNLAFASTSSDPTVHQLLGRRDSLALMDRMQRAQIAAAEAEIEARKADHAAINAQLAELGYK